MAPPPVSPTAVHTGLALYAVGQGKPVLLMPYPHGFGSGPIVGEPLAQMLVALGQSVVAFDPPGAYASTRQALVTMPEMLGCALETLDHLGVDGPLPIVGHSMGGLCALAFAITYPALVDRLVLIGALSGSSAIQRHRGMPWGNWLSAPDRARFLWYGLRLSWGVRSNLALHKRLLRLLIKASYVDPSFAPAAELAPGDERRPAPVRDVWPRTVIQNNLDYRARLGEVRVPTHLAGRTPGPADAGRLQRGAGAGHS